MTSLLEKLQYKGQPAVLIAGAPAELAPHLLDFGTVTRVETRVDGSERYGFALFFVRDRAELAAVASRAVAALQEDAVLWFAYPKGSSRRYRSDIGRTEGWQPLGDLGFEGVRMVAIDEDWSALRLRHVDYIASMKRDPRRAMSAEGKRRTQRKA